MFIKLLLIFTLVPLIELDLLFKVGRFVGILPTIILVASTGFIGVTLAKSQGFLVINRVKDSLAAGQMPADSLIEGLLILIGGVMLLTPGLLTDTTGFCLIIPGSRRVARNLVKKKFKSSINKGNIRFNTNFKGYDSTDRSNDEWDDLSESIDVEYEEVDDD